MLLDLIITSAINVFLEQYIVLIWPKNKVKRLINLAHF